MDINEIEKCTNWQSLLVEFERKLWVLMEHNLMMIEGIHEQATIAGHKTIKSGSSFDIQIKQYEKTNASLARILESKQ